LLDRKPKYTPTASAYAVAPVPPSRSGLAVVGQAGRDGVALDPRHRLAHQVRERRQRHELAGGEEVGPREESVAAATHEVRRVPVHRLVRLPFRLRLTSDLLVLWRWREIHAPALALGDDGHQPRAHAPGLPSALM
jgi:hypothetical protein